MAIEQNIATGNQNVTLFGKPDAGMTESVKISGTQQILLDFSPAEISKVSVNTEGALTIGFKDGSGLVIEDYAATLAADNPPVVQLAGGDVIDLSVLMSSLSSAVSYEQDVAAAAMNEIAPAAGEEEVKETEVITPQQQLAEAQTEGLDAQGVVDPTQLGYQAPAPEAQDVIRKPGAGETVTVALEAGKSYTLGFGIDAPQDAGVVNNNLVITFGDGGQIIIPNYSIVSDTANLQLPDGSPVKVSDFPSMVSLAAQLTEIEPAAGDAPGGGGNTGFGFQTPYQSSSFRGLEDIGPINPTQLKYRAPDREYLDDLPPGAPPEVVTLVDGAELVDETDLAAGAQSVSDTLGATFSSGSGTFAATGAATVTSSVPLTSEGFPVTITLSGDTYTGTAGGSPVFTLVLQTDGSYTFTLIGTLDHPDTSDPDDAITIDFGVTANGSGGGTADGFIKITVLDDGPVANDDFATFFKTAGSTTGNVMTGAGSTTPAASADDLSQDDTNTVTEISFGATTVAVPAAGSATINGNNGTLEIFADGSYTYTYTGQTAPADDVFTYVLTDGDGDSDPATLTINADGQPTIAKALQTVDETDFSAGNLTVSDTVNVDYDGDGPGTVAGDGISSSTVPLVSGGEAVTITFDAATETYTGTTAGGTVFTLVIQPNGAYTYTQFAPLEHPDANDPNDALTISFGITATDSDGDAGSGNILITVYDDGPVANDDFAKMETSDASAAGDVITGAGSVNPAAAADDLSEDGGNTVTEISFGATTLAVPSGGSVTIDGAYGSLEIFSDGSYTYTLDPAHGIAWNDTVTEEFPYVLTDADGDSDPAVLKLQIHDNSVEEVKMKGDALTLDETDLNTGALVFSDSVTAVFESGSGTFSATGESSVSSSVALTSEGNPVTVTLSGNTYTGTAGGSPVFTLVLQTDGSYTFTLIGTLDHPDMTDPDDAITIDFGVTATGSGGGSDSGFITVTVLDDGPVANDDFAKMETSDASASGDVITGAGSVNPAASADDLSQDDDNTVTEISFGATTLAVPSGGSVTIDGAYGTLEIFSDGSYTYTLDPAHGIAWNETVTEQFTYELTDGDGDSDTAILKLQIKDNSVEEVKMKGDDLTLDETNLDTGSLVHNDTVTATFESGAGTFSATGESSVSSSVPLTSEGHPVTVTLSGNTYTGTANGVAVFTLVLQPSGSYAFTLIGTLDHPDASDPDDAITIDFGVTATGSGGGSDTGFITVTVLDDGPVAHDDFNKFEASTSGSDSTSGNVISGAGSVDPSAAADDLSEDDTNTVTEISFKGNAVDVPASGSATIDGDYGTLEIFSDGSYTYTLFDNWGDLANAAALGGSAALDPSSADVSGYQTAFSKNGITISNVTPSGATGDLTWVSEDGAGIGIAGNGSNKVWQPGETLNATFDNAADTVTVTIADIGANNLNGGIDFKVYIEGQSDPVLYEFAIASTTPVGGIIQITLSAADFGGNITGFDVYSVKTSGGLDASSFLLNNVSYTWPGTHSGDICEEFVYELTDGDGDTSTANLKLNITPDDQPQLVKPDDAVLDETDLVGGLLIHSDTLQADFGGDAPGTFETNGSFGHSGSVAGGTLTSAGVLVIVTATAAGYVGTAGAETVFTLDIDPATGDYTFTLLGTLDHADTSNPDDVLSLSFGFNAKDSDGDTASTTLTVHIHDDGVTANNDVNAFDIAAGSTGGNVVTGAGSVDPAASADNLSQDDVNTVTKIAFGGTTVDVPAAGTTTIDGDYGTLEISADGSYTYTLFPSSISGSGSAYALLSGGGVKVAINAVESASGVTFTIKLIEGNGDLNGFFLDIGGDGGALTSAGSGINMSGAYPQGFDYAEFINETGAGGGIVTETTVTIDGLSLADLDGAVMGIRATSTGSTGADSVKLVGDTTVIPGGPECPHDVFTYTLTDGDGDSDTATLEFQCLKPVLIVGKNVDDAGNSTTPYEVGDGSGTITGEGAGDILVGDVGGASVETQTQDYNIALILDVSGSMAGNKLAQLKTAVNELLNDLGSYNGGEVKVHFVPFATSAQAGATFDVSTAAGLTAALSFVNGLTANGYTNYEDPMQDAIDWLSGSEPISGAENYTYFVSDGSPNRYVSGSNHSAGSGTNTTAENRAMDEIQGINESDANDPDGVKNEIAGLQNLSTVIAIGIGVNDTTLGRLDLIDSGGDALNVAEDDIGAALSGASPLNKLNTVGDDILTGGDGDDLIFGDSLFTDALAADHGFTTLPGSGWEVFARLEAGESAVKPDWTRADTIEYIKAHAEELAAESLGPSGGRPGGDDEIYGGGGNDFIYGQEGDDLLYGGDGDDYLSGGSGADTFVFRAGDTGVNTIADFNAAEGDKLDISDILAGFDPLSQVLSDFVKVTPDGGNTLLQVDPTGSGSFQTIAVLEGVGSIDVDTLFTSGNLIA